MEENKNNERKTLAILAIVFGSIGLAFSWVPIINNLAAIFAFAGAVMGIIALLLNRKSKKTKSIIGLVLSVVAIVIVLVTQSSYSKAWDKAVDNATSTSKSDSKTTATKWTQADFDALKKGDMMAGAEGGDKLSDLTDKYGKPSTTTEATVNNMDTKTVMWSNTNGSAGSNVTLQFMKANDGSYLLYSSASTGLK
ncbi:hypothetical protein FFRU_250070 [Fructobacillus fructosus]|uniref:DUF4190 domain-containing protein n=1 Tax=Fructobacillus fructosus TaxID=1631 RepID=UPI0002195A51|nr:DUF4190 domain-containing protein [Fructobacillus fructosus]KRN52170.1 hypothetical protein IV71_GL001434 [Fructobacillus fructosus KCTC 3544]GAP02017.1 hypothetical protein FFRU_250070 [Fructobacillus fructosus]